MDERKELSQEKILISSFMNILENFQEFYEVYTNNEVSNWNEGKRKQLAEKCYKLNIKYIRKQLECIKKNISSRNINMYEAIEYEIQKLLKRYST